jgi:hypothetical protein
MDDITIPITRPSSTSNTTSIPSVSSNKQETQYPTEWIDLPSQGYFYPANHPLSSGKVEVKMMTAKEEDILTNANYIKNGVVLDRLIESVLINRNIKPNDFLVGDKNAVFVALRRLAYGDNYGPLAVRCNACKEESKEVTINLAEIKTKEYNFDTITKHDNLFEFELPFSKHKIVFKLLTSKDEAEIEGEIKAASKMKIGSSELTTRLRQTIVSINGNTDKQYIRKFIENELLSRDSLALRQYIRTVTPNMDLTFEFTCPNCQNEERMGLPLTAQFFWPDTAG